MKGQKKKIGVLLVVLISLIELFVMFFVIHRTSPARRMAREITAGERRLADLDYDEAASRFKKALMIDPHSRKGKRVVQGHVLSILSSADQAIQKKDYDQAVKLSECALIFEELWGSDDPLILLASERHRQYMKQKEISVLLHRAESAFHDGDYKNAIPYYDLAAEKGAAMSELEPNYSLSRIYEEIIGYADESHYGELAKLLDGPEFAAITPTPDQNGQCYITETVSIEKHKDHHLVLFGELDRDHGNGTATAVISGGHTYSVYSGEWNGFRPEGDGELRVWFKDEGIAESAVFSGSFHEGLCNGPEQYRYKDTPQTLIEVREGKVENIAVIDHESTYIAGVYGFGGSDDKPLPAEHPVEADWRSIPGINDPSYEQAAGILDSLDWNIEDAFNWSAGLTYYGHGKADMPESPDPGIHWFAAFGFSNHKGNCFVMAATFYEFAKLCGYQPRQMCGMVPSRKGGLTIHSWVEIDQDGQTYVYDPDFQYNKGLSGFGLQYGQQGTWRYQDYSQMSE